MTTNSASLQPCAPGAGVSSGRVQEPLPGHRHHLAPLPRPLPGDADQTCERCLTRPHLIFSESAFIASFIDDQLANQTVILY